MALKRVAEAEALLRDALASVKATERGDVLSQLGLLLSDEHKDAAKALEVFEEAAAIGAVDDALSLNIAEMLIRLNRLDEGRARATFGTGKYRRRGLAWQLGRPFGLHWICT